MKPCESYLSLVDPRSVTQCGFEWGHAGNHRFRDVEWSACKQSCGHIWCGEKCSMPGGVVTGIELATKHCPSCGLETLRGDKYSCDSSTLTVHDNEVWHRQCLYSRNAKVTISLFAFKTREEAVAWRNQIRGQREFKNCSLTIVAPHGAVLTAHVVGPNRRGQDPKSEYLYAVGVGCRRVSA